MSTPAEQDQYVEDVISKYQVPPPNPQIKQHLETLVRRWAGPHLLSIDYSGSLLKATAVRGESDMDFFISLATAMPLQDVYQALFDLLNNNHLNPRKQDVSVHINYLGAEVDLTPGRLQGGGSGDHSLYVRRKNTWRQTNVTTHIKTVAEAGRRHEIRAVKIWRNCHTVDLPSFYLELITIDALRGRPQGTQLAKNVLDTLEHIAKNLVSARVTDPANAANVISDDLTRAEKQAVASKAKETRSKASWSDIIW